MPYIDVNDIRMYYEEQGQGEPLVLLLGATGGLDFHAASWGLWSPAFPSITARSTSSIPMWPASATAQPWVSPWA